MVDGRSTFYTPHPFPSCLMSSIHAFFLPYLSFGYGSKKSTISIWVKYISLDMSPWFPSLLSLIGIFLEVKLSKYKIYICKLLILITGATLIPGGVNNAKKYFCFTVRAFLFVCFFVWFLNVLFELGYIAEGPQDKASDNFTCCHTRDRDGRP